VEPQHLTLLENLHATIIWGGSITVSVLATAMWWFFSLINSKLSIEEYKKDKKEHVQDHKELQQKLEQIRDKQTDISTSIASIDAKLGSVISEKDLALKALLSSLNVKVNNG